MRFPTIDSLLGLFRSAGSERPVPRFPSGDGAEGEQYFSEQIKGLRANFEDRAAAASLKVVGITSAVAGEGKSLLSSRLAHILANVAHRRVLLVGLDMRKGEPSGKRLFPESPGMSEYLSGKATLEEVVHVYGGQLSVIPTGRPLDDPAYLLTGERFRQFLSRVRDQYDYVLIDTPPVLPVADTLSLRPVVDGFLVIFRMGHTPCPMFRQAVEEIGEERIVGVVLNGVEQPSHRYYTKYYGPYYHRHGGAGRSRTR